jgi:outer membrane immunogenic protein
VGKNRFGGFIALVLLGAFGVAGAHADEMTAAPAAFITGPTSALQWTGVYFGADAGYGSGRPNAVFTPNDRASLGAISGGAGKGTGIPFDDFSMNGALAGGQIGYNWQINALWLTGVEADYQWADLSGLGVSQFHLGNVGGAGATSAAVMDQSVKSFGTVRLRMGVVPINPVVLYVTTGLAFGQVADNATIVTSGSGSLSSGGFSYSCVAGNHDCFVGSASRTMVGWTAGGGGEFALTTHLTFKAELLFVDLGVPKVTTVAQNTVPGTAPSSFLATLSPAGFFILRGGLNFRF